MKFRSRPWRALGVLGAFAIALSAAPQALASGPAHRAAIAAGYRSAIGAGFGPIGQGVVPQPSQLKGVYCTSSEDCWAVGSTEAATSQLNHVLHWNGKKWSEVDVPSPGGTDDGDSVLRAVRCATVLDCWAVGDYSIGDGPDQNQILHWNGKKWIVATVPQPGGTRDGDLNQLFDIACTSTTSCWAAGGYGKSDDNGLFERNEALHWNGKTWTQAQTPNPAGTKENQVSALLAIRCATPIDCWGLGADGVLGERENKIVNEALHWNGKKWGNVAVPNPAGTALGDDNEFSSLSCTSATNCMAAGFAENEVKDSTRNETLRWDGKSWRTVPIPNPDGTGNGAFNVLASVNCIAATDCWTVGETGGQKDNPELNEAMHWNGARWSVVSTPQPAGQKAGDGNELFSLRCNTVKDCWAVGFQQVDGGRDFDQTLHWTGKRWFVDNSSFPVQ